MPGGERRCRTGRGARSRVPSAWGWGSSGSLRTWSERVSACEGEDDHVQDGLDLAEDLIGGEAKNGDAARGEEAAAAVVEETGAVELDREAPLRAEEVEDEGAGRVLATEL